MTTRIPANLTLPTLVVTAIGLAGCSSSSISSTRAAAPVHAVNTVALAPSGGIMADAVGIELFNHGFQVFDTAQTSNLFVRLDLSEVEVARPAGLRALVAEGIDAYIAVRSVAGAGNQPQSASVRVNSTHNGAMLAGLTWENGWGGMAGSIADRTMRSDLSEAADEIAEELAERLRPSE